MGFGRGTSDTLPEWSMLHRSRLARELNVLMGCSVFTAWNVLGIPHEDLVELQTTLKWTKELSDE